MFHVWNQIEDLWVLRQSPFDVFLAYFPHFFRYTLLYPILLISEKLNISPDVIFSIFICLSVVGIFFISFKIISYMGIDGYFFDLSIYLLCFSCFMMILVCNGRGILATLGILLLFFLQYRWDYLRLSQIIFIAIISLFLTSVSNGVLVVYFTSLFLFLFLKNKNNKIKSIYSICSLSLLLPFVASAVYVSTAFYNFKIYELFFHGPFFYTIKYHFLFPVFSSFFVFYFLFLFSFVRQTMGLSSIVPIVCSCIGLFGILTFFSILPVMLILFLYFLPSKRHFFIKFKGNV